MHRSLCCFSVTVTKLRLSTRLYAHFGNQTKCRTPRISPSFAIKLIRRLAPFPNTTKVRCACNWQRQMDPGRCFGYRGESLSPYPRLDVFFSVGLVPSMAPSSFITGSRTAGSSKGRTPSVNLTSASFGRRADALSRQAVNTTAMPISTCSTKRLKTSNSSLARQHAG
jgi:hypothetical protein